MLKLTNPHKAAHAVISPSKGVQLVQMYRSLTESLLVLPSSLPHIDGNREIEIDDYRANQYQSHCSRQYDRAESSEPNTDNRSEVLEFFMTRGHRKIRTIRSDIRRQRGIEPSPPVTSDENKSTDFASQCHKKYQQVQAQGAIAPKGTHCNVSF